MDQWFMTNLAFPRCALTGLVNPRSIGSRQRVEAVFLGLLTLWCANMLLAPQPVQAQLFEDPPKVLKSDETLTEAQNDHVEAVTLYAHGRVLLQRGLPLEGAEQEAAFAPALRRFQRAWWFEHDLVSILEDIVPLAFRLDRKLDATRYLILAAEQQDVPVELLEQIAAQVADLEDFDPDQAARAWKLFQKVKQLRGDAVRAVTLFEIGRLSLTIGKFEEAAEAFAAVQQAVENNSDTQIAAALRDQLLKRPDATYALFGESYLRAGKLDVAEAAFRTADKAKPNAATLGFRLALVENERGHRDAALKHLDAYFHSKTTSAGLAPYVLLAELLDDPRDAGPGDDNDAQPDDAGTRPQPSEALLHRLRQLAQADPNNPLLGYFLADRLRLAGKLDEAESLYRKLLEQEPAADGHQGLIDIYLQQQRYEPLLRQVGEVVWKTGSLDPLDANVDSIAEDPAILGELTKLTRAMLADPENPPPRGVVLALALLQGRAQNADLAQEFLNAGLKQPGPAAGQAAINIAFQMFQMNKPEPAARAFQRVLDDKLLPEQTAEVSFYLAGAWTLAKDYEKALEAARQAGKLDPTSPRMLAREPWVLYQARRLDEAQTKYVEILDRFDSDHASPENREGMRDVRLSLSAIEVERKKLDAAEEWLQQVLDEFPEDIGAFNDLGYLWCDQGKHLRRSLAMVQRAVEAEPDNIAYRDSLGWALFRLGRYEEAVKELEKAAAAENVDGVILDHLADAYAKSGQAAQALETWQKAAEEFQRQEDTERLQAIQNKIQQHTAG